MSLEASLSEFARFARTAKNQRKLHSLAEQRLTELLHRLYPATAGVSEVSGVLGGRNDLIQFFFNGRRVVFEMFFSPSQVPQDLRLLEQSEADVKIAVLLDREVDPRLATEYFRKKPDSFPFLWLSEVLVARHEAVTLARLQELIDENAAVQRLRRLLASPVGPAIEAHLGKQLTRLEEAVTAKKPVTTSPELTVGQAVALRAVGALRDMGIPADRLRSLYAWLAEGIKFAFTLAAHGFQAFLLTDLHGYHAVWSDMDVADVIFPGAAEQATPRIVLCLNKYINEAWVAHGIEPVEIQWHSVNTYGELRPAAT